MNEYRLFNELDGEGMKIFKKKALLGKKTNIYIALSMSSQEERDESKHIEYLNGSNPDRSPHWISERISEHCCHSNTTMITKIQCEGRFLGEGGGFLSLIAIIHNALYYYQP